MNSRTVSAVPDESVKTLLLEHFTPVDAGVHRDLAVETTRRHVGDLMKRLSTAAEITRPGEGAALIARICSELAPDEGLLRDVDAVLEFGRPYGLLTAEEKAKATRAEIRQEVLHFDRIMDLDHLDQGARPLKHRRDFVHDDGALGAAERILVLVHERLVLRGARPARWQDVSSVVQQLVGEAGDGARLERTRYPFLGAVAAGPGARDLLGVFERYAIRHPLPVAIGLTDYLLHNSQTGPQSLVAAGLQTDTAGTRTAEIWAAGRASWMVLARDGFRQRVVGRGLLEGARAGSETTRYGHAMLALEDDQWLVLALDGGELARAGHVEDELNRPGRSGRIDLAVNLGRLLGRAPYTLVKPGPVPAMAAPTVADSEEDLQAVCRDLLAGSRGVELSLECGHVHADREVGPAQIRGLELGARLVDILRQEADRQGVSAAVDVTPMVDDDHVLNRFRFADYEGLFDSRGLAVDDLILESSPLPRAVAHDVLRRAVSRDGQGYRLHRIGGNLYLESGDLRVEMVEDLEGEMRNGCVMFEIGLIAYRAARRRITAAFTELTGRDAEKLHRDMARAYDGQSDPAQRASLRREFERLYIDGWDEVTATLEHTPFLDAFTETIAERERMGRRTVVLNVIEDYYRPQQEKVDRVARLLGIRLPMQALFFSPHGHGLVRLG
ncbi:hypothetical protein GCM10010420_36440 [Streptomyces glaucosporus]|uniref:Uncharacterized protein n=1 Tax=Streptomyces glaucosporus TaxID=284044 RepID=A0ABP5VNJ6_9ACTN